MIPKIDGSVFQVLQDLGRSPVKKLNLDFRVKPWIFRERAGGSIYIPYRWPDPDLAGIEVSESQSISARPVLMKFIGLFDMGEEHLPFGKLVSGCGSCGKKRDAQFGFKTFE